MGWDRDTFRKKEIKIFFGGYLWCKTSTCFNRTARTYPPFVKEYHRTGTCSAVSAAL